MDIPAILLRTAVNLAEQEPETLNRLSKLLADWHQEQMQKPYAIPDPMQVLLKDRKNLGWKKFERGHI